MKKYLAALYIPFVIAAVTIKPTGMVTDTVPILSNTERNQIEALLRNYKERTTNEIAVLIVPTLGGDDIKAYANRIFHEWGIGQKEKNNGVLFLWSTGDRKMRFEVGYGLEAVLTDGRVGDIIRDEMVTPFRSQQWMTGLQNGLNAVIKQIDSKAAESNSGTTPTSDSGSTLIIGLIVVVGCGVAALITLLIAMQSRRKKQEELSISNKPTSEMVIPKRTGLIGSYEPPQPQLYTVPRTSSIHATRSRSESVYIAPVEPRRSRDSDSDSSSSPSSSDFGGFSGGDSGGGGADGGY